MGRLLTLLMDICLLRRGPQHVPASTVLAVLLISAHLGTSIWLESLLGSREGSLGQAALYSLIMVVFVYSVLRLRHLATRSVQTLSAFAGAGALVNLFFLPLVPEIQAAIEADRPTHPLIALAWMGLFFWSLAIDGHIFRHALSISFSAGLLMATLMFALAFTADRLVFGLAS